ncbi:hypothetical protein ACIRQP_41935 [Streptomyces sp. NPDC102274]|uniref:hypothetical protein n=1 Tax=Streptomyces sp. NPDC102274 TaxID=3366151 RepID=UPI00381A89D8
MTQPMQPETEYTYTDPTDAFGHTPTVIPLDASTYDGTIPVVSPSIQVPPDATDPENPIVYVPTADVERVVAAIRTAAGQPTADRGTDLLRRSESYLSALHGSVARHDESVSGLAEVVARLPLRPGVILPGLLVREDPSARGSPPAGRDSTGR